MEDNGNKRVIADWIHVVNGSWFITIILRDNLNNEANKFEID